VSKWPGKYVIGLTGNIATGKSVVRKMLEHLGAYSIDADALGNRAIARGAPGYKPALDTFGRWLLESNEEINRQKLGRLVFSDPEALTQLEGIIHPLVIQAVDMMIRRAKQKIVVVEAIKLLETDLRDACDSAWVTLAPERLQITRLTGKRGLSEADARQRIQAQSSQEEKANLAAVIIQNTGSFEDTWKQVVAAWKVISPITDTVPVLMKKAEPGELTVQRGRPRDSVAIAELLNRLNRSARPVSGDDIMAAFGEKAFLMLVADNQPVGLAGWQVENLVARTTDLFIDPGIPAGPALKTLVTEVESASQDLQCEASLFFLTPQLASYEEIWREMGYERRTPQTLGVQAWTDAAIESMPPDTILLFKQLRMDRVLRPI